MIFFGKFTISFAKSLSSVPRKTDDWKGWEQKNWKIQKVLRAAGKECFKKKVTSKLGINGWCWEIRKINCLLRWWS